MRRASLGTKGLTVSAIGLGCMGMSQSYGKADLAESERTLRRAVELGIDFFDTADGYGWGHNEQLLGRVPGTPRTACPCWIGIDPEVEWKGGAE